jgi:hypothetical protein
MTNSISPKPQRTTVNDLVKIKEVVRKNMRLGVYCPLNGQSCLSLIQEIEELRTLLDLYEESAKVKGT